jgi:hypothetical protein
MVPEVIGEFVSEAHFSSDKAVLHDRRYITGYLYTNPVSQTALLLHGNAACLTLSSLLIRRFIYSRILDR